MTKDEFLDNIRNFDTSNDRTYYISKFKLLLSVEEYIEQTKKKTR